MAASYSQDFRRKVIEYVKKGNSCHKASLKFEIASNTVRNWNKRYELEGNFLSRKVGGKKGRVSKEEVESYVSKNPNFILSEMGKHFGMSAPGALYWLRKLGYSYKKSIHLCGSKRRKKKEIHKRGRGYSNGKYGVY